MDERLSLQSLSKTGYVCPPRRIHSAPPIRPPPRGRAPRPNRALRRTVAGEVIHGAAPEASVAAPPPAPTPGVAVRTLPRPVDRAGRLLYHPRRLEAYLTQEHEEGLNVIASNSKFA